MCCMLPCEHIKQLCVHASVAIWASSAICMPQAIAMANASDPVCEEDCDGFEGQPSANVRHDANASLMVDSNGVELLRIEEVVHPIVRDGVGSS